MGKIFPAQLLYPGAFVVNVEVPVIHEVINAGNIPDPVRYMENRKSLKSQAALTDWPMS